jgi:hypothetical protein
VYADGSEVAMLKLSSLVVQMSRRGTMVMEEGLSCLKPGSV